MGTAAGRNESQLRWEERWDPGCPADGRWQPLGVSPLADTRFGRGTGFQLGDGGWTVQFSYLPRGREPHRFDLKARRLTAGALSNGQPPRTTGLDLAGYEEQTAPTLAGRALPMLPGELARAVIAIQTGAIDGPRHGPRARARDHIDDDTVLFQRLEHTQVRHAASCPAAQGNADANTSQVMHKAFQAVG